MASTLFLFCLIVFVSTCVAGIKYDPNWESLDRRETPSWFDEAKFGIFMHWGVYSVPSFGSEWFWEFWQGQKFAGYIKFMKTNYRPDFTYGDFANMFTAEFFNPVQWADIIESSGAKYVVLTSKHHEGFTMWPSKYSWNWNAMDVGPKRDLVGELAAAIRNKTGIRFGLYHSLFEWFNPHYLADSSTGFKTQEFVKMKTMPELYEIVTKYKPEILWSDGVGSGNSSYWDAPNFLAWLFNDSPVKDTVATNDRWGTETLCLHGGYFTCTDRYNPGRLLPHKWENCMTLDRQSWGYRRQLSIEDVLSMEEVTQLMAETVSCGGNLLMNVGPTHDGIIVPIFQERLQQTGQWLKVNGEAIYASKPWSHQNDTITKGVWYTSKVSSNGDTSVYAIVLNWPTNGTLILGAPEPHRDTVISLLGYAGTFGWKAGFKTGLVINIPVIPTNKMPCEWAWVFKLTGLHNQRAVPSYKPFNKVVEMNKNH